MCRAEAVRNGDKVVAVYADHAISGTDAEHRPEFQRMVADSAEAPWEVVYVYKVDRFARNRLDSAVYKARLRKNGVRVVSATERIQDGPDGILLESLLEGMAEYYSANLSENIKRGMEGNAIKCHHNGVTVYGYDNQPDGTVRVNEREAAVVRTIFRMWGGGSPTPEILDALKGERTRSGKPISAGFVSKVIRNDRYQGRTACKEIPATGRARLLHARPHRVLALGAGALHGHAGDHRHLRVEGGFGAKRQVHGVPHAR